MPVEVLTADWDQAASKEAKKGSLIVGPGLGLTKWDLLKEVLQSEAPLVLDADAITLIARNKKEALSLLQKRAKAVTVFTPHPQEAARLLDCSVEEIESDRFDAIKRLCEMVPAYFILKGKGTCVRGPGGPTFVITEGDTGLSKGGSGDLLSGILGTMLVQNLSTQQAVLLSVYLHGRASELLTQRRGTSRSSLPSEIASELGEALRELESCAG
jgi:NAD(P)H-hydrate epimerase